jgi:hypothetical protein
MSDPPEFQSSELLNPIPDKLEVFFALVSAAPVELEIICVLLVLESFEYQPVICDELHVGPSNVTLPSAGEIVAIGQAEKPLDQEFRQQVLFCLLHSAKLYSQYCYKNY